MYSVAINKFRFFLYNPDSVESQPGETFNNIMLVGKVFH